MAGELLIRSPFALAVSTGAIELRRGPSLGHLIGRLAVTLLLLPFLLAPLLLLLEPEIPSNVPAALFYLAWYGALVGFAALAGVILFRWRRVRFDGDRGCLDLRGSGRFLWIPRRVSVPFDGVRELRLALGPEGLRPTPFVWRVTHGALGARPRKLVISASVETVDDREEALDLSARIARLMGWSALELVRGGELGAEIRFARSEAELEHPRPIPPLEGTPAYGASGHEVRDHEVHEENAAPDPFLPSEAELPRFDPLAYEGVEEIVAWEPGRRVELVARPFSGRGATLVAIVAGLVFGAPVALFLWGLLSLALPPPARPWLVLGLAGSVLAAAAVVGFLAWRARQTRRVTLDWTRDRVTLRKGGDVRSARLDQVRAVHVRGVRGAGRRHRDSGPRYRCEVVARLERARADAGEISLLETRAQEDPARPYRAAAAFAAEVAQALGAPWAWDGYRGRT